jgi:hypothetical protein
LVRLGLYVGNFFYDWHGEGVTKVDLHVGEVTDGRVVE